MGWSTSPALFIRSLYDAARIFLQPSGIAWFKRGAIDDTIRFLSTQGSAFASDVDRSGVLEKHGLRTGEEAGYLLRFLWYVGLVRMSYSRKRHRYSLSSFGRAYAEALAKKRRIAASSILYEAIRKWEPLLTMLHYVDERGSVRNSGVVRDLGGDMERWTAVMKAFGFVVRPPSGKQGVKKPYDSFVVRNCLVPLAEEFGLLERSGAQLALTELGKNLLKERRARWEVIRSAPDEPFVYAAICGVLFEADEAVVLSPWIDESIAERLAAGLPTREKLPYLRFIVRKPDRGTAEAIELLRTKLTEAGGEIEVRATPRAPEPSALHAKAIVGDRSALVTSANLQRTSLWRNFEVGVYFIPASSPELGSSSSSGHSRLCASREILHKEVLPTSGQRDRSLEHLHRIGALSGDFRSSLY